MQETSVVSKIISMTYQMQFMKEEVRSLNGHVSFLRLLFLVGHPAWSSHIAPKMTPHPETVPYRETRRIPNLLSSLRLEFALYKLSWDSRRKNQSPPLMSRPIIGNK